jgi:ornithine cyclodeaminase/alanine dehydrogenase
MSDVVSAVEQGFRALGRGEANVPTRLHLDIPARGVLLEMPAYAQFDAGTALGTKIVSVFEENSRRGLDSVQAVYLLLDSETGVPLSLMDGKFLTAIRTAATSAVATKYMSAPGSKRLAVFGAGVQAHFHIQAMIEVAKVESVMISSKSSAKAKALADRVRADNGLPVEQVSAEKAATAANLICTCTSSGAPLFDGELLTAGTHINAVGAFTPSTRELDSTTVRRARVIIDHESAAGREAGEIAIPISEGAIGAAHVKGTLAGVLSGEIAGRESAAEITLFKSCGLAIEDLVTAQLAYSRAMAGGAGTSIEF